MNGDKRSTYIEVVRSGSHQVADEDDNNDTGTLVIKIDSCSVQVGKGNSISIQQEQRQQHERNKDSFGTTRREPVVPDGEAHETRHLQILHSLLTSEEKENKCPEEVDDESDDR
jgi:hypothetical protein